MPKVAAAAAGVTLCALAFADPLPFRQYLGLEYYDFPLPHDYAEPAEWVFARLMYPPASTSRYGFRWGSDWSQGGTSWTIDYPRGDRHISEMVRRLTAVDARSVEQPVNLDDGDDVFYWPWLYAVEVGTWDLTDEQAAKLREYLLRGGFLMVDDFHDAFEWGVFVASMRRVFPERPIVDIPRDDPIFHVLYDVEDLSQIPGAQYLRSGVTYEQRGVVPHWRAIYDDEGRIMVAICHNMDLGDAVEHSDTPQYPENYSSRAMRTFINYIVYSMTH
ncbi:MAG: DUF4159 domain-containing protein [Gammaproteobacteria bacterium]|nr:DUF4159 domain-containing protein [Gammaproteobacteria bacterium]